MKDKAWTLGVLLVAVLLVVLLVVLLTSAQQSAAGVPSSSVGQLIQSLFSDHD